MTNPRLDMDRLSMPKVAASAALPFARAEPASAPAAPAGAPKPLMAKPDAAGSRPLRDIRIEQGRQTGRRVTHQEVTVAVLRVPRDTTRQEAA